MTEHVLQTRGARLRYTDQGQGKLAYIFLHYWGGAARIWDRVVAELESDARCVAINQRGWGGSEALDGRYDLNAMADDVLSVVSALDLGPHVLVGHSMGGKVAQIVAARTVPLLSGLVLIAPAPPEALAVPAEQRAAMLASYQSPEGARQAIAVLSGRALTEPEQDRIIADTLAGVPEAKREWTERGMIEVVGERLSGFKGPVRIVVGDSDSVEQPNALRAAFADVLPQAVFELLPRVGHLSPVEAPEAIARACREVGLSVSGLDPT